MKLHIQCGFFAGVKRSYDSVAWSSHVSPISYITWSLSVVSHDSYKLYRMIPICCITWSLSVVSHDPYQLYHDSYQLYHMIPINCTISYITWPHLLYHMTPISCITWSLSVVSHDPYPLYRMIPIGCITWWHVIKPGMETEMEWNEMKWNTVNCACVWTSGEYAKCFVTFKYCLIYTQTICANPLPCKGQAQTVCMYVVQVIFEY